MAAPHSDDLTTWHRVVTQPLEAESRWYEKHGSNSELHEAWRDTWVYPDAEANGWHMLVTACASAEDKHDRARRRARAQRRGGAVLLRMTSCVGTVIACSTSSPRNKPRTIWAASTPWS